VTVKVKDTDYSGEVLGKEDVLVTMTKPQKTNSALYTLQDCVVQTAYCVLPGQDPRGIERKECQDNLFISLSKGVFLAALFDGHGSLGKLIVEACTSYMSQQYETLIDFVVVSFRQNSPREALVKLVEDCDQHVIHESGVDASLSGSTAVLLLITPGQIYSAVLGDSRGVLGCVPGANANLREAKKQTKGPYIRQANPGRILVPLAVTLDQKPNMEAEMTRIRQAGGIVQKITNSAGHKVGPYRVWRPGTSLPGLAMSRSIGDNVAKSVGVIGTPVVQQFSIDYERDLFAVIASDGVW
jgi:serine/threonine protein phosphatase PrpC